MNHQPALGVHDIGRARLPDLDLSDHIPDRLQVDLGNVDTPSFGVRFGNRHVWLGAIAEIDRSVIGRVEPGLAECYFQASLVSTRLEPQLGFPKLYPA